MLETPIEPIQTLGKFMLEICKSKMLESPAKLGFGRSDVNPAGGGVPLVRGSSALPTSSCFFYQLSF